MQVRTRLLVVAVALPTAGLVGLALLLGAIHAASLAHDLDARLLAQAAVEAESLFDEDVGPHLHEPEGPTAVALSAAISVRAIYRPDGALYLHAPRAAGVPPWIPPPALAAHDAAPALGTRGDERVIVLPARDQQGGAWFLRLAAPLASVEAAVVDFALVALAVAVGLALVLAALVWPLSWRVVRGLERLVTDAVPHLDGTRPEPLPQVAPTDELAVVHNAVSDAALRLQRAREARDRLLAHAAHELRTPLSLMRTEIDLALRRERSVDELRAALGGLGAEVDRLATLTTSLLDLERLQRAGPLTRTPTDLAALARESLERFRRAYPELALELHLATPTRAAVDPELVRVALDNLVGNAIKHSPPGGRVTVGLSHAGRHATFEVSDEGPGLPASERERVFEPFYRAPGAPPGTGLGLAIVARIAALHGGRVHAAPSAHGARFQLDLGPCDPT